jgi:hypothetical protein
MLEVVSIPLLQRILQEANEQQQGSGGREGSLFILEFAGLTIWSLSEEDATPSPQSS